LPDAVFVGDSTQPVYTGNLTFNPERPRRWFNSSTGYGTLGYALPAAIGAWLGGGIEDGARPPVVCLIGDGGLQFTLPELASAVEAHTPVIVLLWNNQGYEEIKKYMVNRAIEPVGVDFGALLAEQASAIRLMMTIAQIVKHVDGSVPVRFLIAETETGYTLLAALWLARLFGIEQHIEISPLFETASALEQGATVLEEALRSPHYRAYLQSTGRLALQFGYSDSGRYVGQLAASYLIERLRLKIGQTLAAAGVTGVEVILFDTHGESVGRGAHPGSLADRLKYLSPTASRQALNRAGLSVREESAFQGGDGYLLFGTPELALATITCIAQQTYHPAAGPIEDPVYANPDFAADFFATVRAGMEALVDDQGYAALLGTFGPSLLDVTGSRPTARQADGMVGAARIRHPRELRAIPNNAILQQLGWCANTLQGIGAAAARHPELFTDLRENSRRFHRAVDLASHALAHSDIDVLRAVIATLDPGTWLDRADRRTRPGRSPRDY